MSDNRTALLVELCRIMRDYELDVDNAWTNHGTVASPGKFEGEPIETLYYHSRSLNGMGEPIGDWDVFEVDDTERQIFGLAPTTTHMAIREDSQGFTLHTEMTREEYQQVVDAQQEDDSEDTALLELWAREDKGERE